MRDVFSNETLKEINDLIDEIIENLDDNVETVENPLSVSRENGIASIFTATNYDGTQRVFSASDTTMHILLDGNEDAGKSQQRSLKFTIGDKNGVAFEKNDDDTRYYIWWESDFGIDRQNNGCLWFRFDGDYGTDDTYPVKAYYTYEMTGLTAGKTYTITFTGGFGTTTPENFNLGGALIISELVGQTMTTIAQEDFDSDAQTHSYSVTFTPTGTEVYLKFDFTNVIKTSDPHALVFAVDEFTYTGLDLGVTGAYVWFDGWHLISTGGGGGTSDLDAIELTYAEYQALSPAEKTDPDKIYFITDYPSGSGVVINPTGTATDTAETIEVDGTIYDFAGTDADAVHTADIGVAGGVAELDSNGKVPSSQLPSYVDDVVEYASISAFPATGESGKIYVALDTNKTYRWTGSVYVEISPSLALGETSSTAYRGDRGKIAYDHSQSDHSGIAPAFTEASTRANIASGETFATLLGKIKKFFSDLKAVAFSGSYNDLSDKPTIPAAQVNSDWNATSGKAQILNKPTIPTVNNATLTIQKNGTNVETFTANASSNKTANITVPTKVSELTNDSGYTTNTGTVTQVKVGSTAYNPSSGVVSLPAYPTTLPASDVYSWAKASSKPSYTASEVSAVPRIITKIPATTNPSAGWRRICKITYGDYGYENGFVTISGGWNSGAPSSAIISICCIHTAASMTLIHNFVTDGMIQQVRLVNISGSSYWFDAYMKAQSGGVSEQYFIFFGNFAISDIQNSATIITDGTASVYVNLTTTSVTGTLITSNSIGSQSVNYATSAGSATSATKATQDGDGNTISSTYLKLSGGTLTGGLKIQSSSGLEVGKAGNSSTSSVGGNIWMHNVSGQKNAYNLKLHPATLTANRDIVFPNDSGTVALTYQIPSAPHIVREYTGTITGDVVRVTHNLGLGTSYKPIVSWTCSSAIVMYGMKNITTNYFEVMFASINGYVIGTATGISVTIRWTY